MQISSGGANHKTKQEFVYQTLREAIMRCELEPGEKLGIQDIARQLVVSPIPVREALRLLYSEGLVEHSPHVGSTVARISRDSVVETFTVKEGLEVVSARIATQKSTSEDLSMLSDLLGEMDNILQSGDYERWANLNTRFHMAVADISAMPMLREMTRKVLDQWDRIRSYFFREVLVHRLFKSQEEHRSVVQAINKRDCEQVERLVKAHNQDALEDYLKHMSESTEEDLTTETG